MMRPPIPSDECLLWQGRKRDWKFAIKQVAGYAAMTKYVQRDPKIRETWRENIQHALDYEQACYDAYLNAEGDYASLTPTPLEEPK